MNNTLKINKFMKKFFSNNEEKLKERKEKLKEIKEISRKFLEDKHYNLLDIIESLGYDEFFIEKALSTPDMDKDKLASALVTIIECRNKFYGKTEKISLDFIISSQEDKFACFFGQTISKNPCLIIKVKNTVAGKQSVDERIAYGFFLFESGMSYARENGVSKISIIYDRSDYDQDKHFDSRIPNALTEYQNKNLFNVIIDWVDNMFIINLGYFYKMMFEIYKAFAKKNPLLEKVKIITNFKDLLNYFDKETLPEEYR